MFVLTLARYLHVAYVAYIYIYHLLNTCTTPRNIDVLVTEPFTIKKINFYHSWFCFISKFRFSINICSQKYYIISYVSTLIYIYLTLLDHVDPCFALVVNGLSDSLGCTSLTPEPEYEQHNSFSHQVCTLI